MDPVKTLSNALSEGTVIFDGAIGTEVYRRGVFTNRCYDELCLTDAKLVRAIHDDYCEAGADVLTTNTFGANALGLGKFGLGEQADAINRAAVALARETADAAGRPVFVAGSIGPLPATLPEKSGDGMAAIAAQVRSLTEAGADLIFFETQRSRTDLERCAAVMGDFADMPFVLSCTVYQNGESASGEPLARLLAPLPEGLPAPLAWGLNCGVGPDALLAAAEQAVRLIDLPLIVQPNAGVPKDVEGRQLYMCSPSYLASYAQRYVEVGVSAVGGCCGTSPDHIKEIAQRLKPLARRKVDIPRVALQDNVAEQEPTPWADRSRLASRLARGQWVTTVEILPPRGYDLTATIAKAKKLYRQGVDALNLPDGPRASSRMSPLVTAFRVQREAQIEVILHFCARDRNLIGMQADLLACAACSIPNILFVTGDPPKLGDYPFASGVFDVDSIGMCAIQDRLNRGIDIGGQAINPKTNAVIGVGADPTALDQDREVRRFREKVEAGAEFAITQPVFDTDALLRFLDAVEDLHIPIMAGIWPLASFRNASFMQNEVPGVNVPDEVMKRMASVDGKDDQRQEGIAIAREMVDRVRDRIAGIQVSAPFGNIDTALGVIRA